MGVQFYGAGSLSRVSTGAGVGSSQRTCGCVKSLIPNSLGVSQGQVIFGKAISQDSTLMARLLSCGTWMTPGMQAGCKCRAGSSSVASGLWLAHAPQGGALETQPGCLQGRKALEGM